MPKMDAAIRDTLGSAGEEALLRLSERLWREPVWDLKIVAGRILALDRVAPNECVWRYVAERMGDLDGWAVADNLASVGSRCLLADPRRLDVVESWVESPHLWTRRASLVFTLPWTKAGRDPERMLAWAARLSSDPQWFIQKAIGWWLRQLGKRDPDRVRRFLAARWRRPQERRAQRGDEAPGQGRTSLAVRRPDVLDLRRAAQELAPLGVARQSIGAAASRSP